MKKPIVRDAGANWELLAQIEGRGCPGKGAHILGIVSQNVVPTPPPAPPRTSPDVWGPGKNVHILGIVSQSVVPAPPPTPLGPGVWSPRKNVHILWNVSQNVVPSPPHTPR